jgi:hypothetical protein
MSGMGLCTGRLGRRKSYRSTLGTTRVRLILTLAWLLIISKAQPLFRRMQKLVLPSECVA